MESQSKEEQGRECLRIGERDIGGGLVWPDEREDEGEGDAEDDAKRVKTGMRVAVYG